MILPIKWSLSLAHAAQTLCSISRSWFFLLFFETFFFSWLLISYNFLVLLWLHRWFLHFIFFTIFLYQTFKCWLIEDSVFSPLLNLGLYSCSIYIKFLYIQPLKYITRLFSFSANYNCGNPSARHSHSHLGWSQRIPWLLLLSLFPTQILSPHSIQSNVIRHSRLCHIPV